MNKKNQKRLNATDLINVGIYTALYLVIFFVVGMLNAIPFLYPVLFVVWPIVTGIPFMLYLTKVKKVGMVFISSVILAVAWFLLGYPWYVLVTYPLFGIIAEIIFKIGNYKNFKAIVVGYWMFCMGSIGIHLPIWFMEGYVDSIRQMMGDQYTDQLLVYMPNWMPIAEFALVFIGALIGALLGKKMLKKHFERAGIA